MMFSKARIVTCLFLCSSVYADKPASLGTITLNEAVMLALRNNPSIISNELNRVTQKYQLAITYHQFELQPSLTGSANSSYSVAGGQRGVVSKDMNLQPNAKLTTGLGTSYTLSMTNPTSQYYNPQMSLTITQPLIQGFGEAVVLSPLADALDQEKINKMMLRDAIVAAIQQVVKDYRSLITSQRSFYIQQLQLNDQIKSVENNQLRIKSGQMAPNENTQAQLSVKQQEISLLGQQNSLLQARQQLLLDIGLDPNLNYTIIEKFTVPNITLPPLELCKKMALENSTAYQSALINQRVSQRALRIAQDQLRWQLNLTSTTTTGGGSGTGPNAGLQSLTNGKNYSQSLGLSLTVPVDTLQLKSAVVTAKINLQNGVTAIRSAKQQLETQVINTYKALVIQKQTIALDIEQAKLAQDSLDQALIKYKFGRITQFEVNSLRITLISSQISVVSDQINYLNSLTDFNVLLGNLLDVWHIKIRY